MKLNKKPREEFDYLTTIKNINKLHGSPKYLSKENKKLNINSFNKDPILNENIPIKVRLMKAAHLNPNFNLAKINKKKSNSKVFGKDESKEISNNQNKSNSKAFSKDESKEINNNQNKSRNQNVKKYNKNKTEKKPLNQKEKNNEQRLTNNIRGESVDISEISKLYSDIIKDNDKSEIIKYKNLLISPKIMDNELKINKKINIKTHKCNGIKTLEKENNNKNNKNTFNSLNKNMIKNNLLSQNFTYNKPTKERIFGSTYSMLTKKNNISKDILFTESRGWGGISSDNILSNVDNFSENSTIFKKKKANNSTKKLSININNNNKNNDSEDIIKVSKNKNKTKTKYNNIKPYIRKKNSYSNNNKQTNSSPIRVKNYHSSNNINITNNNYKYIYLSPKKEQNQSNSNCDNIEIKLDELILFEERLNDINIAFNHNNIYDRGASNECVEFIVFYFHSSLKNIFPLFFNGMNKVIIKSAINLQLFSIIISYHLSLNPALLNKLLNELKNILNLTKINLFLFVRKIQIYYGEKYTKQNSIYFKNFNYFLSENGFMNYNEKEIVQIINKNCCEIVNNLNSILNYYKSIDNLYYLDFIEIFASISKVTETEIHNYFCNHLCKNTVTGEPRPKYNPKKQDSKLNLTENNINLRNNSESNTNLRNNIKNKTNAKNKEKEPELKIILKYHKYKISPPFLKKPNEKKYTLVLDLEETLISINHDGNCILRPGLFSFLSGVKPYYELISFTNESKYSSDSIIKQIETRNKYFDYNLYREHLAFNGREFIKDITKIGRDIKKIIIVDNIANNFKLNPENGIQISPFFGEYSEKDTVLSELKKILILFYKSGFEDLREAINKYEKDIKKNITKDNKE